jgi:hypothetical protein
MEKLYGIAKSDKVRMFNNMKTNKKFQNIIGYCWKVRYTAVRGFHYQFFFFYDGTVVSAESQVVTDITDYWHKVTGGRGRFFNNVFLYGNTWLFNSTNLSVIDNLKKKLAEIADLSDYSLVEETIKGKTFGKSESRPKCKKVEKPLECDIKSVAERYDELEARSKKQTQALPITVGEAYRGRFIQLDPPLRKKGK